MNALSTTLGLLLATFVTAEPGVAQSGEQDPRRAKSDAQIVKSMIAFCRRAEGVKAHSRARRVYRILLDHYDEDQATARRGLGFKQVSGAWRQVTAKGALPADAAQPRHLRSLDQAWKRTARKANKLHRELGLALLAEGRDADGAYQLRRALVFDAADRKSHEALGHEQLGEFWGSDEQIRFVRRARKIEGLVDECANLDTAIEPLDATKMPKALQKTGLDFQGARSKRFQYWVVGSQEDAINHVLWSERTIALLDRLTADIADARERLEFDDGDWIAVIRTADERDHLLRTCPGACGEETFDRARLYGGLSFHSGDHIGRWQFYFQASDADRAVAGVTKKFAITCNNGLSEGLVHTMTNWLCGSVLSRFMKLAHTVSSDDEKWERDPAVWQKLLEEQIADGLDWQLAQLPRERMNNFREPCRAKAWSFVNWLLIRYPDKWFELGTALDEEDLDEQDVRDEFESVLDRSLDEIESEWREWARADSPLRKASNNN